MRYTVTVLVLAVACVVAALAAWAAMSWAAVLPLCAAASFALLAVACAGADPRLLLERGVPGVAPAVRQPAVPGGHPAHPGAAQQASGALTVEADGVWGSAGDGGRVCGAWAALDAGTRPVVAVVVGDRSGGTARRQWAAYRDPAIGRTDFWAAYSAAVPHEGHAPGGTEAGRTGGIGRLWCAARQRCSRVVRKPLSFPECPRNHPGALWTFIRRYSASRR